MATSKNKPAARGGRIGSKKPKEELPSFVALEREARESGESDDPRRTDRIAGLAPESFAQRLLNPSRPQLDAVREAVDGIEAADEAWEVLAARELIPVEWTTSTTRQIVCDGLRCAECGERVEFIGHTRDCSVASVPATVAAAATLACDPTGVAAAEALARTSFERMYGDTAADEARLMWRVGLLQSCGPIAEKRPGAARAKSAKPGTWEEFRRFRDALGTRTGEPVPPGFRHWKNGLYVRDNERMWNGDYQPWQARPIFEINHPYWVQAVQRDVVNHWSWALSVREKKPNPFTPLCEVWALGYAVDHVDDETIVLYAPQINSRANLQP